MEEHPERIQLEQSGIYEIQVQGLISQHWLEYFDGFSTTVTGEDGWAVTTLTGRVVDQAALQGILQHLYTLGFVLLSIKRKKG
jgi:hypothetical protein